MPAIPQLRTRPTKMKMKFNRLILKSIGQMLSPELAFSLAKSSRHLRHLVTPGRDHIFDAYLGVFKVLIDTTYPIESAMLTGRYDHDTSGLIESLVQPDWLCMDVGANVGAISLALAKAASAGRVIAIEPGPGLCERMRRNIEMNPSIARHIEIIEVGVSDKPGQLFWKEDDRNRGNAGLLGQDGIAVPVTTVDSIVAELNLSRLDFIKIDVEGMELEVIGGALNSIKSLRPFIYYETLEPFRLARGFDFYSKIYDLLSSLDYQHFAVRRGSELYSIEDFRVIRSNNVLAIPLERVAEYKQVIWPPHR